MTRARWTTLDQAVATIRDGALIAPGGFMLGRAPMALVFELVRQGRTDLHVISLPNPLPAEILVAAEAASKVEFLFAGVTLEGKVWPMHALKRAIEAGSIDWQEHDGYRIVQRLRAAAMGVPFLPVPGYGGNDLARADPLPTVEDPFTGEQVPVERAMHPDVALIHAQEADDDGNLFIEDPTTDRVIAEAAKRVVATAERRVKKVVRATIPGFMVDLVVEEPQGAYPTGCTGYYDADEAHLAAYLRQAKAGEAKRYIDEVVRGARRQADVAATEGGMMEAAPGQFASHGAAYGQRAITREVHESAPAGKSGGGVSERSEFEPPPGGSRQEVREPVTLTCSGAERGKLTR